MAKNNGNTSIQSQQKDTPVPMKDTQIPPRETEVTKWLEANNADVFNDEFYKQGYYKVESVDDEAINSIVKAKQPGLANALKNSLAEQKKRKEEAGKTIPPPKLPADTVLDLSAPKLKSADGITFSVPKTLSAESNNAAIVSPNNIKPEEWMVIARSANLLYAYDMDGDEPKWAKTPVLDWKVPTRDDFVRSEILHGKVTSMLTYSEETASYVASGFDTQTATAGYAFCSASFERSHKEKTARSSETKTLIQVGMWKYPRAKIYLEKCTTTSERFTEAVRTALAAKDKYAELNKVFDEYGHVIPSAVLLGGQLCFKDSSVSKSSALEHSEETQLKASVEAKVGKVSASTGWASGSASETKTSSLKQDEFESFTNHGGDSLLCTNPPVWAPTVKDPNNWAVIEMEDMKPTIELLDPSLRQQVIDVWNRCQAILKPKELDWKDGEGVLYPNNEKFAALMQENGGFAVAMRQCSDGPRGWVQLVSSGSKGDPKEHDLDTACGAAYAHKWTGGDNWIDYNSVCLPVPQGGSFTTMFKSTWEKPADARLVFIPSNLHFGQWECLSDTTDTRIDQKQKDQDGFLFVSIQADQDGDCGGVKGLLNGKEVAGSYVHYDSKGSPLIYEHGEHIIQQSFCIPVPKSTQFSIASEPGANRSQPMVYAYWLPLIDERWKMQAAVSVTVNTQILAETDGILHGWIKKNGDGDRGTLKFEAGDDAGNVNPAQLPCAAISMHYYEKHDRWVLYSSAMIPVAKGTPYKAAYMSTCGNPKAEVFWTAIVPR